MIVELDAKKVQALFLAASELNGPEREAFLNQECLPGTPLRDRLEQLLKAHDGSDSLFDRSISAATEDLSIPTPGLSRRTEKNAPSDRRAGERLVPATAGSQIGPYTIIEEIGHGGMGVVYAAEQSEPVRRRVALKIIKPGMDSRNVIARFEVERQALSLMDHPHIAKVLDAGTTATGLPFFAMELVQGQPITQYCDERQLSLRERLLLFIPVCKAIQHAHQKGIIHRDIKPSNILIAEYDGRPAPKVIDFGVAKALHQPLTEGTMFTEVGQIVGTPEYLSPEQALGNPAAIDTRSDVYSLGVLLYELLAGVTPFDGQRLRSAAWDEMLRIVREEEPPRPSTRLSSSTTLPQTATNRQTEAAKLAGLLQGELDWIVMRALEKDQTRRYETANALAEDIQRYLDDEPVHACPPSKWYRTAKFTKRNKGSMAAVGVVAAAMLLATIISSVLAVRAMNAEQVAARELQRALGAEQVAREEAARAQSQEAIATAISEFLCQDLLSQANPFEEPDPDIRLRTIVDRAASQIDHRFHEQPLVEASIRDVLGDVYGSLDRPSEFISHMERSYELYSQELGPEHHNTLAALLKCAYFHGQTETIEQVLETRQRLLGDFHPDTLFTMNSLAKNYESDGRLKAAFAMIEPVIAHYKSQDEEQSAAADAMNTYGNLLRKVGRTNEALAAYDEGLRIEECTKRKQTPISFRIDTNIATTHSRQGNYKKAIERIVPALDAAYRTQLINHSWTAQNLCELRKCIQDYMAADSPSSKEEVLGITSHLQQQFPDSPVVWTAAGIAYYELGDGAQAVKSLEKSIGLSGGGAVMEWFLLSLAYARTGNTEAAREWFDEAFAGLERNEHLAYSLRSLKSETARDLQILYEASAHVRTAWRTEMQHRVARLKITDAADRLTVTRPHLLHEYRDLTNGTQLSLLWSWGGTGRPLVLGCTDYLGRMDGHIQTCLEMTSLADQPFVAEGEMQWRWSPIQPGITLQAVPDAAAPAADTDERKAQMQKVLARLEAHTVSGTDRIPLELTPVPACRYADPGAGVLDGAVFLFMEDSNPEIAAVIEACTQEDGSARWEWAFARLTAAALSIGLDEQQVWADSGGLPATANESYWLGQESYESE